MPNCKCPNCGAKLSYRFFLTLDERPPNHAPGLFQHTAPVGFIASFIHRVIKNKPLRQLQKPDIIVRSEVKQNPRQTWINELKIQATPDQLGMLGIIYLEQKNHWSRDNTIGGMNVSQTWHNEITKKFLALKFLEQYRYNRYRLTEAGESFLSYYLYSHPWRK